MSRIRIHILVAITAAGLSERMGRPKALLAWGAGTFLEGMISASHEAGLHEICVVVGADGKEVGEEARRLGAEVLVNFRYLEGRTTSLAVAARRAERDDDTHLLVWPVDCPAVSGQTLLELAVAAAVDPTSNIVPEHEGRGGHPVILCPNTIRRLSRAEAGESLRDLLHSGGAVRLTVPVEDPSVLDNVNTKEEYRQFLTVRRPRVQSRVPHDS